MSKGADNKRRLAYAVCSSSERQPHLCQGAGIKRRSGAAPSDSLTCAKVQTTSAGLAAAASSDSLTGAGAGVVVKGTQDALSYSEDASEVLAAGLRAGVPRFVNSNEQPPAGQHPGGLQQQAASDSCCTSVKAQRPEALTQRFWHHQALRAYQVVVANFRLCRAILQSTGGVKLQFM